jgi:hypothetical protein
MSAYQLLNPDIVNSLNLYCFSATIGEGGMNTSGTVIAPLFEGTTGIFQQYSGMTGDAQYFSVGTLYIAGGVTGPGAAFHTYTETVTAPVTSITFSGFFATGNKINISGYLQTDYAANYDIFNVQFNGDTGPNYGYTFGDGQYSGYSVDFIGAGYVSTSQDLGQFTAFDMDIPRYSQNVSSKGLLCNSCGTTAPFPINPYSLFVGGTWSSTAAITSVTFTSYNGSNFIAGSNLTMQIS